MCVVAFSSGSLEDIVHHGYGSSRGRHHGGRRRGLAEHIHMLELENEQEVRKR